MYIALNSLTMSLSALQTNYYLRLSNSGLPVHNVCHSPLPGVHSSQVPFYRCSEQTTLLIAAYQITHLIPGWKVTKCRFTSCQRTLVQRWDLNPLPFDLESGDLSTRPQHLYKFLNLIVPFAISSKKMCS